MSSATILFGVLRIKAKDLEKTVKIKNRENQDGAEKSLYICLVKAHLVYKIFMCSLDIK